MTSYDGVGFIHVASVLVPVESGRISAPSLTGAVHSATSAYGNPELGARHRIESMGHRRDRSPGHGVSGAPFPSSPCHRRASLME